jgi:cytochrome c2
MWLLFFALLVPAGVVGWAIGHYTHHSGATGTRTVTVTSTVTTSGAGTTTAEATAATPTATTATTTSAATPTTTAATTTSAAAPAATAATTTAAAAGNAAAGKAVFTTNGCGTCHAFKPAGSTGTIGPDLDTQPAADAKKANMPLAAFLHESIVQPDAYISPGFPKGVMPATFGSSLSAKQLGDLVAFLQSGAQ